MKKHLFLGFLGALALSACSSDEPMGAGSDGNGSNEPGVAQYLTVNIVSTPASRDAGDANNYEEGTATENAVSKVRFYFFRSNGDAANVHHSNNTANFYDWTPEDAGQDMPNVEKQLTATIVIHTGTSTDEYPTDDAIPSQMIAVLNPDVTKLGNGPKSISDIRAISEDYESFVYGQDNAVFVMTNAVYKSGTSEIIATPITETNFQTTPELAKNYPVNIYVERNVAKVRVKFDREGDKVNNWALNTQIGDATYNLLKLKDKDGEDIKVTVNGTERQVYVRFFAWDVTAKTDKAYLSKHIDVANWADGLFGTEAWNFAPYFRSYWALNAPEATQSWISFNDIDSNENPGHAFGANGVAYINENAPQTKTNLNSEGADIEPYTKVIIKAQLMYFNNSGAAVALELCKYAGLTIIGKDKLEETLLNQLNQNGMIYRHWEDAEGKHVASLTANDVTFKTAMASGEAGLETEAETGRYYVYLQTTDAFTVKEGEVWNTSADAQDMTPDETLATKDLINTYLKHQLGATQIYSSGYTYYYFPIQHLGDENCTGFNGVVRNHIYDCVIDDLRGLGTPVFDPYEDIYPEKPKEEDVYIGAKINILSWRVVPNKVKLEW